MGRVKKSSKISWKRIKHPDVNKFLDEERERERHNFEDASNNALFSLDSKPEEIGKKPEEAEDKLVDLSKLKCFQIFKPSSTVPDPLVKRNKVRINLKRIKVSKEPAGKVAKRSSEELPLVDLWEEESEKKDNLDKEWLSEDVRRHNSKIEKKRIMHRTTELKPIEIPHPGFSINPTFGDHQELIRAAVNAELETIRREEKLKKATSIPANAVQDDQMMKLETFMGKDEDEVEIKSETEGCDDDKKPVIKKIKTKKQRRKERLAKEAQQNASDQKQTRVRESDVYKVKQFKREIELQEQEQKKRLLKRVAKKQAHEKFGQKALSKWKFEEDKLNPLLSDELSGRLIGVKSTASILMDRFKSLQKRNILEVRVKQRVKRVNRLKKFQRPSEKLDWEVSGVWNDIKL